MTPVSTHPQTEAPLSWLAKAEAWLDSKGKGAWIASMVLGFVFFWPVGLALLAYMIWSKKMFGSCSKYKTHGRRHMRSGRHGLHMSSGNSAFDAYKADTLERLEREQSEFEDFLQRLRDAKDKSEFDDFMDERARAAASTPKDDTGQAPA